MTTKERIQRMFEHREADRIPMFDIPWDETIARWHKEGMPANVNYLDYFGMDHIVSISVGTSPFDEVEIVEETEEFLVYRNIWGAKMKKWKKVTSTQEFLEYKVTDPDSWQKAKHILIPQRDHVDWNFLKKNYPEWRKKGYWIQAQLWFGFDITHSWIVGTERMLVAFMENPEWCMDMFSTQLEYYLTLYDMIWDAGYKFDAISWPDDLGYKQNQFFSLNVYREVIKPFQQRAIDWAHQKGIKAYYHSCGDIRPMIPDLMEMGLDALNPLEVKAGMDPIWLKQQYGDKLVLHGGINAALWDKPEQIKAEMERVVPTLKENGGYIFSSDHSVPSTVSLEDFRRIIELAKELGRY